MSAHIYLATCTHRTLALAGLAAALVCGALSLRQLGSTQTRATQASFTEVSRDANARVLREMGELHATGGALFAHSHEDEGPCGESCTKDHAHAHTLMVRPQQMESHLRLVLLP